MKTFLKVILTIFIVINFMVLITSLTTNILLRSTLLSNKYVTDIYTKYDAATQIADMIFDSIESYDNQNSLDSETQAINDYKNTLKDVISKDWVKEQSTNVVLGIDAYLTNNSKTLPTLQIKPIKEATIDVVINQVISNSQHGNDEEYIDNLISLINVALDSEDKLGVNRDEIIGLIKQNEAFSDLDLSDTIVSNILDKVKEMEQQQKSNKEIYHSIVEIIVTDQLNLDKIKNELSLDSLSNKIFEKDENPLLNARKLVFDFKYILLVVNILSLVFLLVALFLINWSVYKSVRLIGIVCIPVGLLEAAISKTVVFILGSINSQNQYLASILSELDQGILNRLVMFGIITAGLGVLFIIISIIIGMIDKKKTEIAANEEQNGRNNLFIAIRVVGFIIITAVMYISIYLAVSHFRNDADKLNESINCFSETIKQKDVAQIVSDELGIEYQGGLEELMK